MNTYSIALFLHIVGALGLSVALGVEWTGLRQIRNAALPEQVRVWTGILKGTNKVGLPSMLMMVVTGIYMTATVWGRTPWLVVTMVALVLMIALARAAAPRLKALEQSFIAANDLLLWFSIQTRVAITLGIIFLKIAKPDLGGSLLTIGVAIILGIASALPMRRPVQAHEGSTD
jgi:hypothetical protein